MKVLKRLKNVHFSKNGKIFEYNFTENPSDKSLDFMNKVKPK